MQYQSKMLSTISSRLLRQQSQESAPAIKEDAHLCENRNELHELTWRVAPTAVIGSGISGSGDVRVDSVRECLVSFQLQQTTTENSSPRAPIVISDDEGGDDDYDVNLMDWI